MSTVLSIISYLVLDNAASASSENPMNAIGFGKHRSECQGKASRQQIYSRLKNRVTYRTKYKV